MANPNTVYLSKNGYYGLPVLFGMSSEVRIVSIEYLSNNWFESFWFNLETSHIKDYTRGLKT